VYVFGTGKVKITNSIIRNNANFAVRLENGASGEISGTQILASGNGGVYAYSTTATTTIASVNDSVISGGSEGVLAYTTIPGAVASIFVSRSTIESTFTALDSQTTSPGPGSSLVTVSGSTITNNTFSFNQANVGAVIESAGNNHIRGNANTSGSLTIVGLQ
jgi:hypothetical protein